MAGAKDRPCPRQPLAITLHCDISNTSDRDAKIADIDAVSAISLVGGKGSSLVRLCRRTFQSAPSAHAIAVPPGFVLTTEFFATWIGIIHHSDEWKKVESLLSQSVFDGVEGLAALEQACGAAKDLSLTLSLDDQRKDAIQSALIDAFGKSSDGKTVGLESLEVAVRSSSPDEDTAGASFAGLYETELGVKPFLPAQNGSESGILGAVRRCFASCLDARVWMYKRERGMLLQRGAAGGSSPALIPSIAVVVQRMVPASTSGVAFSLNPLTNDYDEVMINAAWGVGEALVSGDITPDSAVLECCGDLQDDAFNVIEYRVGDKGGDRPEERCLPDKRLSEIARTVKVIEKEGYGGDPVDVEWAVDADGKLFVLQARPITTYVPLHPDLQTQPGKFRHLYMDTCLLEGLTTSRPTTPMTNDFMFTLFTALITWLFSLSPENVDLKVGGMHGHERTYYDVSAYLHLFPKKKETLQRLAEPNDPSLAAVLTDKELIDRYRPKKPPKHMGKMSLASLSVKILCSHPGLLTGIFPPYFRPKKFLKTYHRELEEWDEYVNRPLDPSQPVEECIHESMVRAGPVVLKATSPALMVFGASADKLKKLGKTEKQKELVDAILCGHEHDIVVRMGMAMYEMTCLLPQEEFNDLDGLAEKIMQRDSGGETDLSEEFLSKWDDFQKEMGCRGPLEMELASPRYGEAPFTPLLKQMASLATVNGDDETGGYDPRAVQRRQIERREQACRELLATVPFWKRRSARKTCEHYTRWASLGAREMPKHNLVQIVDRIRKLLLIRADSLLEEGRIDSIDDVFEMHVADVDRVMADPKLDVRAIIQERSAFVNKLRRHLHHFPILIDSRGRIVRPRPPVRPEGANEFELMGAPVSGGTATGFVKVLNEPFEKELVKGDILVAVTTDPGWTPLFISAAAVVLQVGGELQHGALVAREYGKPCVTGIPNVMTALKDGQLVEVDGDRGVVRIIQ